MRRSVMVLVVALAGCGGATAADPTERPTAESEPTPGKYEQTWTKEYRDTTCGDWHREMDDHQRFVMAGDILVALWRDEGSDSFPSDSVIRTFARGIGTACEGSEDLALDVPGVAVLLYQLADDVKPPQ